MQAVQRNSHLEPCGDMLIMYLQEPDLLCHFEQGLLVEMKLLWAMYMLATPKPAPFNISVST